MQVLIVLLFVIGIPFLLIWGWQRWLQHSHQRTWPSILSLLGFTCVTASSLLAAGLAVYAYGIGGFAFNDPWLLRFYRWGAWLSLAGFFFALMSVWRPSPLRWLTPVCSVAMFLFWVAAFLGE